MFFIGRLLTSRLQPPPALDAPLDGPDDEMLADGADTQPQETREHGQDVKEVAARADESARAIADALPAPWACGIRDGDPGRPRLLIGQIEDLHKTGIVA